MGFDGLDVGSSNDAVAVGIVGGQVLVLAGGAVLGAVMLLLSTIRTHEMTISIHSIHNPILLITSRLGSGQGALTDSTGTPSSYFFTIC